MVYYHSMCGCEQAGYSTCRRVRSGPGFDFAVSICECRPANHTERALWIRMGFGKIRGTVTLIPDLSVLVRAIGACSAGAHRRWRIDEITLHEIDSVVS